MTICSLEPHEVAACALRFEVKTAGALYHRWVCPCGRRSTWSSRAATLETAQIHVNWHADGEP